MSEEWIVVNGFPDYSISNYGRLKSRRCATEKVLGGATHAGGYTLYQLKSPDGAKCARLAHRLVALHFLPPPEDGQTDVCHNDGNPNHNHFKNLRWDTHQANQMDMREHGTMQDGEKCVTGRLTSDQIAIIRDQVASGPRGTARRLAAEYKISVAHMSRIVNGTRWVSTLGK